MYCTVGTYSLYCTLMTQGRFLFLPSLEESVIGQKHYKSRFHVIIQQASFTSLIFLFPISILLNILSSPGLPSPSHSSELYYIPSHLDGLPITSTLMQDPKDSIPLLDNGPLPRPLVRFPHLSNTTRSIALSYNYKPSPPSLLYTSISSVIKPSST